MSGLLATFRLALALALVGWLGVATEVSARASERDAALPIIALRQLPAEARQTLALIKNGGPFPYPRKDGSVFGNFEKRLPLQPSGYYREYTVPTPGRSDRGPRRIVAGKGADSWARSGEYYYTDDHYRTFRRVQETP